MTEYISIAEHAGKDGGGMMIDGFTAGYARTNTVSGTVGSYSETINPPKPVGWVCPVCGRGLSPYTSVCPCKAGKDGW